MPLRTPARARAGARRRPRPSPAALFSRGLAWIEVADDDGPATPLARAGLERARREDALTPTEWDDLGVAELRPEHQVTATPPPRPPRADAPPAQPPPRHFRPCWPAASICVREGERWFRPDTGRTWHDCDVEEVDHIYACQHFELHDRFLLYALKGRTLFFVGEFDRAEMTLIIVGEGGTGKSTILRAQQMFHPPHRQGILSPNMQPQFGMSEVAEKWVIYCNEVSSDLKVVQEEWQTSVSGEAGSYARKFKDSLVIKIKGQHFWVGNGFPEHWRNNQRQVSRRLAGVLMKHGIHPRDGRIFERICAKLGAYNRKQVLAYFEMVRIYGSTDPMSDPERLPPAFAQFYRHGLRASDPVEAFLGDSDAVTADVNGRMTLKEFRDLYEQFRLDNTMGKVLKWSVEHVRTSFNDRGVTVRREATFVDASGVEHRDVDVVYGLRVAAANTVALG